MQGPNELEVVTSHGDGVHAHISGLTSARNLRRVLSRNIRTKSHHLDDYALPVHDGLSRITVLHAVRLDAGTTAGEDSALHCVQQRDPGWTTVHGLAYVERLEAGHAAATCVHSAKHSGGFRSSSAA